MSHQKKHAFLLTRLYMHDLLLEIMYMYTQRSAVAFHSLSVPVSSSCLQLADIFFKDNVRVLGDCGTLEFCPEFATFESNLNSLNVRDCDVGDLGVDTLPYFLLLLIKLTFPSLLFL